jgi:hypothetical protein
MVIRDRIALGAFAGAIAAVLQLIFNFISVKIEFAKFYDFQLSGSIYLEKQLTYTFWGILLGVITWLFVGAGLGIAMVYLIRRTGKDFWWLKGVLISNFIMYTLVYGFFFAIKAPHVVPWDIPTNWSVLIDNTIFGLIASFLIVRWNE